MLWPAILQPESKRKKSILLTLSLCACGKGLTLLTIVLTLVLYQRHRKFSPCVIQWIGCCCYAPGPFGDLTFLTGLSRFVHVWVHFSLDLFPPIWGLKPLLYDYILIIPGKIIFTTFLRKWVLGILSSPFPNPDLWAQEVLQCRLYPPVQVPCDSTFPSRFLTTLLLRSLYSNAGSILM